MMRAFFLIPQQAAVTGIEFLVDPSYGRLATVAADIPVSLHIRCLSEYIRLYPGYPDTYG